MRIIFLLSSDSAKNPTSHCNIACFLLFSYFCVTFTSLFSIVCAKTASFLGFQGYHLHVGCGIFVSATHSFIQYVLDSVLKTITILATTFILQVLGFCAARINPIYKRHLIFRGSIHEASDKILSMQLISAGRGFQSLKVPLKT